jgi:hypothetical protein
MSSAVRGTIGCREEYETGVGRSNRELFYCPQTENIEHFD